MFWESLFIAHILLSGSVQSIRLDTHQTQDLNTRTYSNQNKYQYQYQIPHQYQNQYQNQKPSNYPNGNLYQNTYQYQNPKGYQPKNNKGIISILRQRPGMSQWNSGGSANKREIYNPNYGYEPYWPGGDWVFEDPNFDYNSTASTTKIPMVCGDECNYLYRQVGKVCAHKPSRWHKYEGCLPYLFCYNDKTDKLVGFSTFDTYCQFLDNQCKPALKEKWVLIHVGPCAPNLEGYFKHINDTKIEDRLHKYMTDLSSVFRNVSIQPFGK